MSGKHHVPRLIDRVPPRLWLVIGSGLAVAFVAGMVLLVQSNRPAGGAGSALIEPPRSAAVVSAASTPTRTVSALPSVAPTSPPAALPAPEPAPPGGVGVEPQTRPPAANRPTENAAPAPDPPRTTTTAPRPAADVVAATYSVGSSWDTGFIGSVEVRNISDVAQTWSITVRHAGSAGVRVTTAWNATLTRQGDTNVFTGGPLAPGASVRLGFEATKQVSSGVRPTTCSAQRGSCRVS